MGCKILILIVYIVYCKFGGMSERSKRQVLSTVGGSAFGGKTIVGKILWLVYIY
jgi:hypothetical protein